MFECYFLKLNIENNKHCNKMQNILRNRTDTMASTQVELKFVDNKENIPLPRKRNLENETKMQPPCYCLFQPPCLIHFAVFSNLHLLRLPVYAEPKSSCFTKDDNLYIGLQ